MADQDKLREHQYDGIQEYENDLPRWWVNIFWLTAVFGVFYIGYTHFYSEPVDEQLARELADVEALRAQASATGAGTLELTDEYLLGLTRDAAVVQQGAAIFAAKCAACHGPQGQGLIGPNMTDNYWIHGGKLTDLRRVVSEGVPEKGMISWKTMMSADEMNASVAYIWTLQGSNPPNPKAPEGQPAN